MNRLIVVWLAFGLTASAQIQRAPDNHSFLANNLTDKNLETALANFREPASVVRLHLALPNLSAGGWNKLDRFNALTRIDISRAFDLTDEQLAFAKESRNLRMLTLTRCDRITGSILAMSTHWLRLSSVVVESRSFAGENLKHLKGKPIQSLKVSSPLIRPRHITAIGRLRSLRELEIRDSPKLFAIDLSQFPNLQKLTIQNCGLRRVQGLDGHKHLEHLSLLDCEHVRGLSFVGATSLQSIEITNAEIGDRTVESACGLSQLRNLSLSGCLRVTSVDLARLTNLERLDLSGIDLTGERLKSIRAASRLRRLDLSRCGKLSNQAIIAVCGMQQLKTLDVTDTDFSDTAYKLLDDFRELPRTRVYMKNR